MRILPIAAILLMTFVLPAQTADNTATIDQATMDKWSAPYRN